MIYNILILNGHKNFHIKYVSIMINFKISWLPQDINILS